MSTTSTNAIPTFYLKPLIAGGLVIAADKFLMGQQNMNKSLMLGVAAAGGVTIGSMIGTSLPDLGIAIPASIGDSKTILQRTIEVSTGVAGAYALDTYVLNAGARTNNTVLLQNAGLILAADFVSEYICDYLDGTPLSYLA